MYFALLCVLGVLPAHHTEGSKHHLESQGLHTAQALLSPKAKHILGTGHHPHRVSEVQGSPGGHTLLKSFSPSSQFKRVQILGDKFFIQTPHPFGKGPDPWLLGMGTFKAEEVSHGWRRRRRRLRSQPTVASSEGGGRRQCQPPFLS